MSKVTVQARMPGEEEWKTRNSFFEEDQTDMIVLQAIKTMETWRSNYQDGAELRVHVQ